MQLVLVNPVGEVMEKLQTAAETREYMRTDCLFLTVGEAVASTITTYKAKAQSSNDPWEKRDQRQ